MPTSVVTSRLLVSHVQWAVHMRVAGCVSAAVVKSHAKVLN